MPQTSLVQQANDLLIAIERYWESSNQPKTYPDPHLAQEYFNQAQDLISMLSAASSANPLEDLLQQEITRVLKNTQQELAESQRQDHPDFATALSMLDIQESELGFIATWLESNLNQVKAANARLIKQFSQQNLIYVPLGIAPLRQQAEDLVNQAIQTFLSILDTNWSDLSGVAELKQMNYIYSANTQEGSYHAPKLSVVSIGVERQTRMYQGKVYSIAERMLSSLSHEILGHARNFSLTSKANHIPEYMAKVGTRFLALRPNSESLAWYFEDQIFEYLLQSPDLYKRFNFTESLQEVVQSHKDSYLMSQYIDFYEWFGICTIAKTGKSDEANQHKLLSQYAINPKDPGYALDYYHRNNAFDAHTGRLKFSYIRRLIYAFQDVHKIMDKVPVDKKSAVEKTILTGYWTRQGLKSWLKYNHPELDL